MANLRVDKITSTETFERTGSVQFDRVGDYLTTDLGSGLGDNFTIEFWILAEGIDSGSSSPGMFQLSNTSGGLKQSTSSLAMYWSTSYDILGIYHQGESNRTSADPNENNVWKHYAMVRNNGIIKVYRNGEEVYTATSTTDYSSYRYLAIGGYWSTTYLWKGHISNFRVLNNKALYTTNFKIPMRELEVTPETVLLACQSKTDTIFEKTGKTITRFGSTIANELTPGLLTPIVKSGGGSAITGSVEFNGSGDYLSVPAGSDFYFEDHKFTIECWAYTGLDHTSNHSILAQWSGTTDRNIQFDYRGDASKVWRFYYRTSAASAELVNSTSVIEPNSWYHLAVVADGTNLKLFVNGVLEDTNAIAGNAQNSTANLYIGSYQGTLQYFQGFVSNLRIVKGTALYTHNFIPPTRELKKVPGTVLLCCQDPDNPLTEATGKTITGYGSLQQDSPELVTDGEFESASNWSSAASDWTVGSGQAVINSSNSGYDYLGQLATGLLNGEQYELVFSVTNYSTGRLELSQLGAGNIGVNSPNGRNVFRFTYKGTEGGNVGLYSYTANTASFTLTNVSLKRVFASKSGSNFTPQVGDDRKVTFEGVTKINSNAYFYLPTGDTVTRDSRSGRGVTAGGLASPLNLNLIDYVNISSMGNAFDFGDLTYIARAVTGLGNQTRGVMAGGANPVILDNINYITIATTGNASNFGDLTDERRGAGACASNTRGIIAGGRDNASPSNKLNTVDYINIATTGNALSFGELNFKSVLQSGVSSPTRGVFAGGYTPTPITSIDFITIATTGNGHDFGDLTTARYGLGGVASSVRGVFAGGYIPGGYTDVMDYITIASFGNVQDYGDLFVAQGLSSGASNGSRGIFSGGNNPGRTNTIQYVTITSTGNAKDFGDLTVAREQLAGLSDSHGGLG